MLHQLDQTLQTCLFINADMTYIGSVADVLGPIEDIFHFINKMSQRNYGIYVKVPMKSYPQVAVKF